VKNKMTHQEFKNHILADEETKKNYDDLEDEFLVLDEFIRARHASGKTQAEIAETMGTKASAISRLESSLTQKKHSPSLSTLRDYAKAIGCRLEVHLVTCSGSHL
jgi:DNA-binding XRE family transcriptional regulator